MAKISVLLMALVALVNGDMYLHNPRGSNNRLDEANRERNNANRMFDSQNNNRGGYNVGNLYYYEGSILPIEWTNQHSCGDQNNHCDIILQYMCGENLRDGASTRTIPTNRVLCEDYNCNEDLEYGMHETYDYYLDCANRQRNMGLFTADRNLRGQNARFTRQNENGNRRGYECPEERDYYPYWHPTPWIDIAILTNDATRCPYYRRESENVKQRYYCKLPADYLEANLRANRNNYIIPNNQDECEQWTETNPFTQIPYDAANWTLFRQYPEQPEPECIESLWSRDNHLGNSVGGFPNYFNWTIPNTPHVNCALRIRYNISTGEYDGWNSSVNSSIESINDRVLIANNNGDLNIRNRKISTLDVYSQFNMNYTTAKQRGYVFRQNPVVKIFPDINENAENFGLQLAINTNQFGRTFQDRSHAFEIRSRPDNLQDETIYNLNVRGKRGNIVQVYPGVEYDFVPNRLHVQTGSYVHIQWTGSNTNPNNNDGQGRAGTDRSNLVLLDNAVYEEGTPGLAVPEDEKYGHFGRSFPNHLTNNNGKTFLGLSLQERQDLAFLSPGHYGGELSELDDAGTYFDLQPKQITQVGTYHYMCTRNNNFSNRSQKGKIIVTETVASENRIGWNGGSVTVDGNTLQFSQGDLMTAAMFRMVEYDDLREALDSFLGGQDDSDDSSRKRRQSDGSYTVSDPGDVKSSYVLIEGDNGDTLTPDTEREVTIMLDLDSSATADTSIYVADRNSGGTFRKLDTRVENGMAVASTSDEGVYVAASPVITVYITVATVLFVVIIITIAIIGVVIYFRVRRDKWERVKNSFSGVSRSFQKKI